MKFSNNFKTLSNLIQTASFWYWLNVVIVLLFWLVRNDFFQLDKQPDSGSYDPSNWNFDSFAEVLSMPRTLGYPIFLKIVSFLSPDFILLPHLQFLIYVIAVFILFIALKKYGLPEFQSLITVIILLDASIFKQYNRYMLTESLGASFVILTISFLLLLIAKSNNIGYWLGLTFSIFYSYQIRPAFLFLIPFIPVAGFILLILKKQDFNWKLIYSKTMISIIGISLIPFLAFSTLRLAVVGHFGLVSFGGTNIVAIASQMLTEDMIPQLSPENQEFAKKIIEKRKIHQEILKNQDQAKDYQNLLANGVSIECTQSLPFDYLLYAKCFNYNAWSLVVPVMLEIEDFTPNILTPAEKLEIFAKYNFNSKFSDLSKEIIMIKYKTYMLWVKQAFKEGIKTLNNSNWFPEIQVSSYIFLISMLLNMGLWLFIKFKNILILPFFQYLLLSILILTIIILKNTIYELLTNYQISFSLTALLFISLFYQIKYCFFQPQESINYNLLGAVSISIIAIIYFILGLILVILVEPPLLRYMQPLSLFLPSSFLCFSYFNIIACQNKLKVIMI